VTGLAQAIRWGVGLSPVYAVATVDESFTASKAVGGPSGDLRLMPDPAALRAVAAQPRWAWAPADQYTQDGQVFGCCQRSFAARMAAMAALRGLEVRVGSEIEWFLGRDEVGTGQHQRNEAMTMNRSAVPATQMARADHQFGVTTMASQQT